MDAYRLNVKLYVENETVDLDRLIPIFHRFIQQRTLDELLIDVADYKHVPDGPGVMLIAHDANYAIDRADGELGLLYAHKRPSEGDFESRLRGALRKTLQAARALENESELGLEIKASRLAIRINDRLRAPNDAETYAAVEPVLRRLLGELYGGAEIELSREAGPRQPFGVRVEAAVEPGVATLLERLQAPALVV